jgi:catechol 2,3-dioxygenase-like lactoylglutathione lyase family enzyme
MAMAEIRSVDHVQLPIPLGGAPKARAFYERLLGLREVRDPALDRPGTLRYSLGWQRLDLTEGHYTGIAPQAHLALRVAGVDRLATSLRSAGCLVDDAPLFDRSRLYVEDPFGNRLELIEPEPADTGGDHHVTDLHIAV